MKNPMRKNLKKYLPLLLLIVTLLSSCLVFGDVGNQNRYTPGDYGSGGGDFDIGLIIGYLIKLFIESPTLGLIVIIAIIIIYRINKKKAKKQSTDTTFINSRVNQQADNDFNFDNSGNVAAQIQEVDPGFSADKFTGWAREVFMKIQQAWTTKDWTVIRPFESETLFNQHNQQLNEYINLGKTNVIEKIAIKHCSLVSFSQDGDKEVLVVRLNAVMRDYVIDDATKKVLESDPNLDWYRKYLMTFNRKAGVKTQEGLSNLSTTNCPNCGAPTEITSAGKCPYCGSIITTGEHDWVLTDIVSTN